MITVGIDMSKNSPGVCINNNGKISFLSFMRFDESEGGKRMSKSRKSMIDHLHSLRKSDVTVITNSRSTNIKEYTDLEYWKIEDATLLAESIIGELPDTVDMVGIEGFSYGSKGNSGLDIAGYAYCIRRELYKKYGPKVCVFSPGNVKKTAGKGNAGKDEMFTFFMENIDPDLIKTKLWKGLKDQSIRNEKPVDDIIDSYYVQECTRQYFISKLNDTI